MSRVKQTAQTRMESRLWFHILYRIWIADPIFCYTCIPVPPMTISFRPAISRCFFGKNVFLTNNLHTHLFDWYDGGTALNSIKSVILAQGSDLHRASKFNIFGNSIHCRLILINQNEAGHSAIFALMFSISNPNFSRPKMSHKLVFTFLKSPEKTVWSQDLVIRNFPIYVVHGLPPKTFTNHLPKMTICRP